MAYGDEFFPKFGAPIDLSDGTPISIAHLQHPASLAVASETLLILPEPEPPVPGIVDYKIVNVRGLARYMEEIEASGDVGEFDDKRFLTAVRSVDRTSIAGGYNIPKGVMLLGHEEVALIGRATSPQLDLPETVSEYHVEVANSEQGLIIRNSLSENGTLLFLHPDDAITPLPELASEHPIPDELRHEIFAAFKDLCDKNGNIDYKSADGRLSVFGGRVMVKATENDALVGQVENWWGMELLVRRADDYPELSPGDGFNLRRLYVDGYRMGVRVVDLEPERELLRPGTMRLYRETQLTQAGAQQALKLAGFLKRQKTAE